MRQAFNSRAALLALLALLALVALSVGLLAGCASTFPPVGIGVGAQQSQQTLAKDGGMRVIVQVKCPTSQNCAFTNVYAHTISELAQRAQSGLGVADATARATSGGQVEVDLPGYTNQQVAVSALTAQGILRFIDTAGVALPVGTVVGSTQYPVVFTGGQLDPHSIGAQNDPQNGPMVVFEFQGAARADFAHYTRENVGGYLTVTLDNTVIESAAIQSEIDGQGEISGMKSLAAAQALAAELKSQPLPVPVSLISAQLVSASAS